MSSRVSSVAASSAACSASTCASMAPTERLATSEPLSFTLQVAPPSADVRRKPSCAVAQRLPSPAKATDVRVSETGTSACDQF